MKKLLIVISSLGVGGAEKSLTVLLNEFDYSRYQVDLLIFCNGGLLEKQLPREVSLLKKSNKLHFLYNKPKCKDLFQSDVLKTALLRIYATVISRLHEKNLNRSKQYRWEHYYRDYLEAFTGTYDAVFGFLNDDSMYYAADKISSCNKIAWVHNDYYSMGYDTEMDRRCFSEFRKIVTVTEECCSILKHIFPEASDKFLAVPNIRSVKAIHRCADEFYPPEYEGVTALKLVSVGRLDPIKGYDIAIDAAAIMDRQGVPFVWYIIGEGESRQELEKQIKQAKLEKKFLLCGLRENPYPYVKNGDIFVQPSRAEGKSGALDEAKILHKPIVVANYRTVYDQVTDETAIIVDMNAESLAKGLVQLCEDSERRAELSRVIHDRQYDTTENIADYYRLIDYESPEE